MGQPKGYEPHTLLFRVDESYIAPLTSPAGIFITRVRFRYTRWYDVGDLALAEQARLNAIKAQNIANNPNGIDPAQITVSVSAVFFFNRRTFVTPLLNELGYTGRTISGA
jgi:hypothetical protein